MSRLAEVSKRLGRHRFCPSFVDETGGAALAFIPCFGFLRTVSGSRFSVLVLLVLQAAAAFSPSLAQDRSRPQAKRGQVTSPKLTSRPVGPTGLPRIQGKTVAAMVNGQALARDELAQECLRRFGEQVLESLINKHLIVQACEERNIYVSEEDVQEEITQKSKRFRISKDQWLKVLEKERGVTPQQYASDIVWPNLALQQLASQQLEVSEEELQKAYQSQFGPAVRVRLLAVDDPQLAGTLHTQLTAHPDDFPKLARRHSRDVRSASRGGLVQPIRPYMGGTLEKTAFALQPGELSSVLHVGDQYVILKCDAHLPGRDVPFDQVKKSLVEVVRDQKIRLAAQEVFQQLQANVKVENIFSDPIRRKKMPGVAALCGSHQITMDQLADTSVKHHGKSVLEEMIHRRLLEQAMGRRNLILGPKDLDIEISHAAQLSGVVDRQGQADVSRWLDMVIRQQKITRDFYVRNIVWPSAALKKLTEGQVTVTKEDIRKGHDANYGSRVRCRAIVMKNLRRAQDVWGKARDNPNAEYFGELAAEYSIDVGSRDLQGVVPPIKRHSGQPNIEKEAFQLAPGELSNIIQVSDNYVILFCEGNTEPIDVAPQEVEDLIFRDIYEKKLRIAMSREFERIKENAKIENYLAGTHHVPKKASSRLANKRPTVESGMSKRLRSSSGPRRVAR